MWRALVVGAVGCVTLVVGGGVAAAQEPTAAEVAAAIAEEGWYADPEAVGDREQLAVVAERLSGQGDPMGFALLAAEPPGSSTVFAEDVLDWLGGMDGIDVTTVVVLSDADVGVVSDVWSDRTIDDALDETIDDLRANRTDGLEALADALASAPDDFGSDPGFDDSENSDDGGSGRPSLVLPVLLLGGLIAASYAWRYLSGEPPDGGDDSYSSSSWRRRRSFSSRSSWRSSSRRSSSSSSSRSRRSSRSSSGRGRGGRRL